MFQSPSLRLQSLGGLQAQFSLNDDDDSSVLRRVADTTVVDVVDLLSQNS